MSKQVSLFAAWSNANVTVDDSERDVLGENVTMALPCNLSIEEHPKDKLITEQTCNTISNTEDTEILMDHNHETVNISDCESEENHTGKQNETAKEKLFIPHCFEKFKRKETKSAAGQTRMLIRCRICLANPDVIQIHKKTRTPAVVSVNGTIPRNEVINQHLESAMHKAAIRAERYKSLDES
jgi:hypothetical protein